MFTLDTSKIDKNINFYPDPNLQDAVITKVKEANSPKTSDNSSVLYIYILSAISIIVASTSYKNRKVNKN